MLVANADGNAQMVVHRLPNSGCCRRYHHERSCTILHSGAHWFPKVTNAVQNLPNSDVRGVPTGLTAASPPRRISAIHTLIHYGNRCRAKHINSDVRGVPTGLTAAPPPRRTSVIKLVHYGNGHRSKSSNLRCTYRPPLVLTAASPPRRTSAIKLIHYGGRC